MALTRKGLNMEELKAVAREALDTFAKISNSAGQKLREKGLSLESLAVVNQATAETIAREMLSINSARNSDCQKLRYEPTIARLVVLDEDDNQQTIYISPAGTVDVPGIV
jgi:hypothetical protein